MEAKERNFSLVRLGHLPTAIATAWWYASLLVKGHLILVEGEEGVGKGYFACWCLVQMAKGLWGPATPGLYLTTEEDDTTIQERLKAAGWDPDVDAPIDIIRVNGGDSNVLMPLDYRAMVGLVKQYGYGMVVADVLRDHCAPTEDMGIRQRSNNDETWIRPAAGRWEDLAVETGATVIGLHHRNKSELGSARSKSSGSGAWRQRARLVIVLVEVAGDHALAVDKQNIGKRIQQVWPYDLIEVTEDYGRFEISEPDSEFDTIDKWERVMRKRLTEELVIDPVDLVAGWCVDLSENGCMRDDDGDVWLPIVEVIATETCLSRQKTRDALASLVEQGLVVRKADKRLAGYGTYFWKLK